MPFKISMGRRKNFFEIYGQSVFARALKKVRQPWYRTKDCGICRSYSRVLSVTDTTTADFMAIISKLILRITINVLLSFIPESQPLFTPSQFLSLFIALLIFSTEHYIRSWVTWPPGLLQVNRTCGHFAKVVIRQFQNLRMMGNDPNHCLALRSPNVGAIPYCDYLYTASGYRNPKRNCLRGDA